MYFLYVDDSGSVLNADEKYFVLGGVVIAEEKHYWVNKHLDELASNYGPDPFVIEFHASEIFGGRTSPWDQITKRDERKGVLQEVLGVASREKLPLIACAIQKEHYPDEDIVNLAFEQLLSRFQSFLTSKYRETREDTRGMLVFDKCAYEKDIQRLALGFRAEGTRYRQIDSIHEVPVFVDSKASRGIQLADHIAYSVFRRYNSEDISYFNVIQSLFGEHGLYHMTKEHRSCTCPACLRQRNSSPS